MKILSLLKEVTLSRLMRQDSAHSTGAISAFRGQYSWRENMQRHRSLKAKLMALGYGVSEIDGSYIEGYDTPDAKEVSEKSFFVVNYKVKGSDDGKLELDLIMLGQEFDQDSILSIPFGQKARLVGTSNRDDMFGADNSNRIEVGSMRPGKTAQFMSRVRGRPFVFECIETKPLTTI
jgi:hypothetical protein